MGSDIFSSIINKKKNMILEYADTIFKYTVSNKNKINKTLSNIIDIYFEIFYLNKENDFTDLYKYFSLQNSKDNLLKETISATIKFYKQNNIEDKIENDKGPIILISNVIYLGIILSDRCFKNYNESADIIIEQFFTKYSSKIRVKFPEFIEEFKKILIIMIKKDMLSIKKAFRIFESTNYSIDARKILDSSNNYLVELNYDVKSLSKYSEKDISNVINNGINGELSLITFEQTSLKVALDFLAGNFVNKYFIQVPIEMFKKQKYIKLIDEIFKIDQLKKHFVLMFSYDDVMDSKKIVENLHDNNFILAVNNVKSLKIHKNSFDNIDYVFVNPQFLEMYDGYQAIWRAKGIEFIIS